MTPLRIGLIGLGMMGRNHARVLQGIDGVQLVGVAEPKAESETLFDGTPVLPRSEQLLDLELDACVVATPTCEHERFGLMLAEAGIHALIEKPLADTAESAERIRTAFESRGLVGAVGHIERFNPALRALREHLCSGNLGEVYQVATRRVGPFPDRIRDVGVVLDLATHDIDSTMWLLGSEFASLDARGIYRPGSAHEDLVSLSGQLEDGTITSHIVNWVSPFKERLTTVTGADGALVADTLTGDLTFYANTHVPIHWDTVAQLRGASEGQVVRFALEKTEPLVGQHRAFRDAVLGLDDQVVSLRDGARAVSVAMEIIRTVRVAQTDLQPSSQR